jgi:hypothetical protein
MFPSHDAGVALAVAVALAVGEALAVVVGAASALRGIAENDAQPIRTAMVTTLNLLGDGNIKLGIRVCSRSSKNNRDPSDASSGSN